MIIVPIIFFLNAFLEQRSTKQKIKLHDHVNIVLIVRRALNRVMCYFRKSVIFIQTSAAHMRTTCLSHNCPKMMLRNIYPKLKKLIKKKQANNKAVLHDYYKITLYLSPTGAKFELLQQQDSRHTLQKYIAK